MAKFLPILHPEDLKTSLNCSKIILEYQFQRSTTIHSHWGLCRTFCSRYINIWYFSLRCRYREKVLFHENGLLILKNAYFSKILLFHVELWYLPREKTAPGSTAPFSGFRPSYSPLLITSVFPQYFFIFLFIFWMY